ncbi:ATP-binding protein [Streptomyces sp. NBC_01619]|uniref:ATP-binding protein n=1 Tax=Streptomyces sp. NBC_01619 TaxID=2975901 RepID=UPI0022574987|nr:ATP-binding protein [Streptomyces sp. NBC_01619]MCX4514992.1 ATP-binding protein [Streptomyces sp. NBC_01619]
MPEAHAIAPAAEAPAWWHIALPHTTAAVPIARALIRTALTDSEPAADCDTAELLTAELVANAVEHTGGRGPIELMVEVRPEGCRVEVHDRAPSPPGSLSSPTPPPVPDPWQEGGRGLLLIRTLSEACGHRPTDRGKAVWFRLPAAAVAG